MFPRQVSCRALSTSARCCKPKNKEQLKNLATVLQQGKVSLGSTEWEPRASKPLVGLALDQSVKDHLPELEESYDTIAFMTREDVAIHENFKSRGLFNTFPSEHFFDRKSLLRTLPDEVDLLKTPQEEIDRVYKSLKSLDEDKSVQLKYMARFGINQDDIHTRLRLGNNVEEMCKAGRRGEKFEVSKGFDRIFKRLYPYNIVGFDRSIVGLPMRGGRHALSRGTEKFVPDELIRDAKPFETKIAINKLDVNFLEDEQLKETISPHDPKPVPAEELLRDVGKPLFLDNIDSYKRVEHPLWSLVSVFEKETLVLRDSLYLELARKMIPTGVEIVSFNDPRLRTSQYVVASKESGATALSGPAISYRFKHFNLVPIYGIFLRSRKHLHSMYKHLFKLVLINLDEHVDALTRIKYRLPEEATNFLRKLYGRIDKVVTDKLLPVVLKNRLSVSHNVLLHKAVTNLPFLRMYWMQKPQNRLLRRDYTKGLRRRAMAIRASTIEPQFKAP